MSLSPSPVLTEHLTRLSDALRRTIARRRPWFELIDVSAFSRPDSLSGAISRTRKNVSYFRVNYLSILALVLAASLLSHPLSLFALVSLIAAWLVLYLLRPAEQPLVLFNRTFSDLETMWSLIGLTIFVVFLTDIGSLLISSVLIGIGIVCLHGVFRDPEDLFLDDQDLAGSGMFSIISGSSVPPTTTPAVVSHV
ncbi:PRA1 family protein B3 [Sesamum angolense]|uniref:PRA1 family protein n=1 Tax=Sesamum angolense TaxID=2727404 RepID=A0AAE1XA95_9LAMI|nr:PRA1 family protein B3 [Sesamum angolense]